MKGFQLIFFTQQGRKHGHVLLHEWLMETLKTIGVQGATMVVAQEGIGHSHGFHSYHFFGLPDQPLEITMVLTEEELERVFKRLGDEKGLQLFYAKSEVEFGIVGGQPSASESSFAKGATSDE
ncbi:DUF190 domain-containing protein [Cupriavidus sp. BIC8F]|uniref:DUF190 domain-containing protein n=1 Tax=Cupriavidus sp. BIC8F TaxID=3079014 RepID=UPI00291709E6|nr:DUF190 domain-containing protein [Cupriavidus sp. BIC8F]